MSKVLQVSTCALPPRLAWRSLVNRSIAAWDEIAPDEDFHKPRSRERLETCPTLEDFLSRSNCTGPMLWFFQSRSAFLLQEQMTKWSSSELDGYVLLPATHGYVTRQNCFFVSHYWRTKEDPDPDGTFLRLHQARLAKLEWSYIWVDWTCAPQYPRSAPEGIYFRRCLSTMPAIIRNCAFMYYYPPWEPRMWILYEIAEFVLTCSGHTPRTSDIETYMRHIDDMLMIGVMATLRKHGYRCTDERDQQYLLSWLEVLVILRQSNIDIINLRLIMDSLTWQDSAKEYWFLEPGVSLKKYEGTLTVNGKVHAFHPFPQWQEQKSGI